MTDAMLWIDGSTVLSTEKRTLTNELLRARGISVIELPAEQLQSTWEASQPLFRTRRKRTKKYTGAADRD